YVANKSWRVDFFGLASKVSTILFVVSASVLMRGLPGGLIFCILPVSSSRFLHFPTVDGCSATNCETLPSDPDNRREPLSKQTSTLLQEPTRSSTRSVREYCTKCRTLKTLIMFDRVYQRIQLEEQENRRRKIL
ncbi:hypothetical protein L9F63_008563, partial [Diploptera punctata]